MDSLYRINRFLMYLGMVLYVPLVLAVVAGLFLLIYLAFGAVVHGAVEGQLRPRGFAVFVMLLMFVAVSAGGVSLVLLLGLFKLLARHRSEAVFGVLLSPAHNKAFFEIIQRVCTKLRVRPPEQCYLSPFSEMSISDRTYKDEDGRTHRNVRTLVVGAGLLVHIRIDELTTILAHEMAHVKAGDTRFCWWAWRFKYALECAIGAQAREEAESESSTPLNTAVLWAMLWYYRLFRLVYSIDHRWRELQADRMAARICGPQNVRNALIKTHLPAYLPELSIESLLYEYSVSAREIGDLYEEYRRRWEELPGDRIAAAENQMFLDWHSWYDSHPCLTARLRGLGGIEAREITGPKPATKLLPNWETLAGMMTGFLMRRGLYLNRAYMAQLVGGRS